MRLANPLGRVYAEALFSIARDRSEVDEIGQELASLLAMAGSHAEIAVFLTTPVLEPSVKVAALRAALEGRASSLVADFLCLLVVKRRFDAFAQIVEAYLSLADEHAGRMRASVRATTPLAPALHEEIASLLTLGLGRRVQLETEVDAALIGGAVVIVDDRVYDGSLRSRLSRFRTQLIRSEGP